MKTVIINIGPECVTGASCERTGKKVVLERIFEFDDTDFYNNGGTLDLKPIAKKIKENIPPAYRGCDVQLVLPSYATTVSYVDTHTLNPSKRRAKPLPSNIAEKVVSIGESQTRKIEQTIQYNTKLFNSILNDFYACGINVRSAIAAETGYHNYIAAYNPLESYEESDPRVYVCMVWGTHEISYIFSVKNLPVSIRMSDFSLMNVYSDMKAQGSEISFGMMLKILNLMIASALPDGTGFVLECPDDQVKVGGETVSVNTDDCDNALHAFSDFIHDLCDEIRQMYDHAIHEYGIEQVSFCLNSHLVDECVSHAVGAEFPIAYIDEPEPMTVYDTVFEFVGVSTLDDKFVPIIGAAIESMKKGDDFYDD